MHRTYYKLFPGSRYYCPWSLHHQHNSDAVGHRQDDAVVASSGPIATYAVVDAARILNGPGEYCQHAPTARARGISEDSWFDGSAIAAHVMTGVITADPTLAGVDLVKAGGNALADTNRSLGIPLDERFRSSLLSTCLGAIQVGPDTLTYTVVGDCRVALGSKIIGDHFPLEAAYAYLFGEVARVARLERQTVYELLMPALRPLGRNRFQNCPPSSNRTSWDMILEVIEANVPANTYISRLETDRIVKHLRQHYTTDMAYGVIDALGDTPTEYIHTGTIERPPPGSKVVIYTDGFKPKAGTFPTGLDHLELVNPHYSEATAIVVSL